MKHFLLSIAVSALFLTACNNNSSKSTDKTNTLTGRDTTAAPDAVQPASGTVLMAYLDLKNALAGDNDKQAAAAGNALQLAIERTDKAGLSPEAAKVFMDIASDAKEHAEHIGANAGNIKHQREHFESLSQDIYDLVKAGGPAGQHLYYDHCPMYNKGKGANWISETKEIHNPYLGKVMPDCGSIKEELR